MLDLGNFDDVQEAGTPKPKLKAGDNKVIILKAVLKDNSKGTGKFIQVDVADADGTQACAFFNVEHVKDQVKNIGKAQFKSFCLALGYTAWCSSLDEIIGKEIIAVVTLKDDEFLGNDGTMIQTKRADIIGWKSAKIEVVSYDADSDDVGF
jgi:hypothetical protein